MPTELILTREMIPEYLWEDPTRFYWWIDILFEVDKNGEDNRSIQEWATRWKVTKDVARNFFRGLKKNNMIDTVIDTKLTRIKVLKSINYKQSRHEVDTVVDTKKPKEFSTKTIEDRMKIFYDTLVPFAEKKLYDKKVLRGFYDYWTEPNKSRTKMRWEIENTWDLSRRLKRWNENNFGKQTQDPTIEKKPNWE